MGTILSWFQGVGSVTTAIALCAGGAWALYNFGLRRVSRARIQLTAMPHGIEKAEGGYNVYITIKAINNGNTGIKVNGAFLMVSHLTPGESVDGLARLVPNSAPRTYDVFHDHAYLEPNESYQEDVAIQCAVPGPLRLDLEFLGDKAERTWKTSTIVRPGNS